MKIHKFKFTILIFGSILLTSCSELLYTSVDVLRPAKFAFTPSARNLLIVNNSVTQPSEYGHRTELINQKTKNILIETDSLPIFAVSSLGEDIEAKGFFSTVRIIPISQNKSKIFGSITPLDSESVNNLCAEYHTDAVISLDRLKVNDDLSEYFSDQNNSFLAVLEARFETFWSIHYPNNTEFSQIQFKDTVFWESESYNRKKAMQDLPNRADALVDGALNAGQKTVNRFIPYWEKEDRYLYNSRNKYLKRGMDSVYVKNWKSAIEIWKTGLNKSNNTLTKSQAANNIAVGYEIIGDIDKALDYANQAYYNLGKSYLADYSSLVRISDYIEDLTKRKAEIAKLKTQLGE